MANQALTGLPVRTTPDDDDVLYIVHDPAGAATDHRLPLRALRYRPWSKVIDEPGSSLANWTSGPGTWASVGGAIECQSTLLEQNIRLNTPVFSSGEWMLEFDVFFADPTTYIGAGAVYRDSADVSRSFEFHVRNNRFTGVRHNIESYDQFDSPVPLPANEWNTLRLQWQGPGAAVWVNSTYAGVFAIDAFPAGNQLYLRSYGGTSKWRNIKVWTDATVAAL